MQHEFECILIYILETAAASTLLLTTFFGVVAPPYINCFETFNPLQCILTLFDREELIRASK